MDTILEIETLSKYYGSGKVVTKALDGISFTVEQGEFTAIMGASGSGKSTLLNLVSTVDRASAGSIRVRVKTNTPGETELKELTNLKENALSAFRRDALGFIFQEYNLLDTMTVGENITLPLNLKRTDPDETRRELMRTAEALDITDQLTKFPWELSGGQRQRAACARALITSPALILADEPTGALDSANSKSLLQTFRYMNEEMGSTILMVTHDAVVGSYASRVLFLRDGKIWSELCRGDRSRQELYREILSVMASVGGESDVS